MTVRIAIIIGSIRPDRRGPVVANWVYERATTRDDASFELIDLADHPLPMLDEPVQPARNQYANDHTFAWSAVIAPFDGYIFVTPEYNHAPPASLKNAIDYLYSEWNDKAATYVGYGAFGAIRAVEQLRLITVGVDMVPTRAQVAVSAFQDFTDGEFTPTDFTERSLGHTFDRIIARARALRWMRMEMNRLIPSS